MAKLGWFVSSFTGIVRVDTKRQAFALQDDLQDEGKDPGCILRECDCGCGQPASKAIPGSREAALARRAALRPLLDHQGIGKYPVGWYRQAGNFLCMHGEDGHEIPKGARVYVDHLEHMYCARHVSERHASEGRRA